MTTCTGEPIHIVHGSERHEFECACGWRTPTCSDRRTARQALDTHRAHNNEETTR